MLIRGPAIAEDFRLGIKVIVDLIKLISFDHANLVRMVDEICLIVVERLLTAIDLKLVDYGHAVFSSERLRRSEFQCPL